MAESVQPYNPLDRVELGKSVERALLARPLMEMPLPERFAGAGLYAIYYTGDLDFYQAVAPPRRPVGDVPIYVGRASAPGARKGLLGLEGTTTERTLHDRLAEHVRSIRQAADHATRSSIAGLRLTDFQCRYLVADDIWVPMAEALLIGHYRPVWNVLIDGFGNHGPGSGRARQARSPWDELHPGRPWAAKLPMGRRSAHELRKEVIAHLERFVGPDLDAVPVVDEDVRRALDRETDD